MSAFTASLHVAALRRFHDDAPFYANPSFRAMAGCPLWVISGHLAVQSSCQLYPQKRTCAVQLGVSAKGQKRTWEWLLAQSLPSYSICSEEQQRGWLWPYPSWNCRLLAASKKP